MYTTHVEREHIYIERGHTHTASLLFHASSRDSLCVCVCVCVCVRACACHTSECSERNRDFGLFWCARVYVCMCVYTHTHRRWCNERQEEHRGIMPCVALRCSVLQYVEVCCSILRCGVVCCSVMQCVVLQCMAVCWSVLCYSVL